MKINFTKDNLTRLVELANGMLFDNGVIQTSLGQTLNIVELIHTTSINQLNNIRTQLSKKIEKLESVDEWVAPDTDELDSARRMKELVNLIIGWKRFKLEVDENIKKKEELSKKLTELKESQKTPEDRIKEIEAQLKELEEF